MCPHQSAVDPGTINSDLFWARSAVGLIDSLSPDGADHPSPRNQRLYPQ